MEETGRICTGAFRKRQYLEFRPLVSRVDREQILAALTHHAGV